MRTVNKTLLIATFLFSPILLGQEESSQELESTDTSAEQFTESVETPGQTEPATENADLPAESATPTEAAKETPAKAAKQPGQEINLESLVDWLPWIIAMVMSGFAGAAVVYILVLRKQDRHFDALRQKVIDGKEPVHLLPEEATRLIREFSERLNKGAAYFEETVKSNRQGLEKIIHDTEESSKASRDQTHQTVDAFKGSLNGMLEKISKFMQLVVQDTKETHNQALETKEYSKQISELVHAKEEEITKLKEGYHLQLITPLISAFLKIRDDLHLMAEHSSDTQIKNELTTIEQRIVAALSDLQIEEIEIPNRPQEVLHTRCWETLSAPETTEDPAKHGSVAKIHKRGYQLRTANSEPHVVRKAVVVVFSSSGIASQELAPSPLPNQSNPQPEEAKNHPNNLNQ